MPPGVTTAIFGAGAWGTALAVLLARGGVRTTLWVRRADQLDAFRRAHENSTYLAGIELPQNLGLTTDWRPVASADVVVIAIPSGHVRATLKPIARAIRRDAIIVSATKGIDHASLQTMTQMLAGFVPSLGRLAALS